MKKLLWIVIWLTSFAAFSAHDEQAMEICHFNIGGYIMDIIWETASQSSLLRSIKNSNNASKDSEGHYLINQPSKYGPIVHQFLCNGSIPLNTPVDDAIDVAQIFGLDEIYKLFSHEPVP